MEKNPHFLKQKYDLHNTPEVASAARRTEGVTGQSVGEKPAERIQNYLDRLTQIFKREDPEYREQGITAFKRFLHEQCIIKPEEIPESVFILEQRIARELGHGTVEITEDFKQQKIVEIISGQKQSLDMWIDYIGSPDAQYPDWFKYVAIRSVLEMGKFKKEQTQDGKERGIFQKRTRDTVAMFPPLNQGALGPTLDVLKARLTEQAKAKKDRLPLSNLSKKLTQPEFETLAATEDFNKIYTQFLIEMPEYSTEGLEETRGTWVKFDRGTDPKPLVDSLEGYSLEWCTRGYDVAKNQLKGGDFYVYYSRNQDGEDKIPRVAIRMEENRIAEVRGIAPNQNTDPYIAPVIEEKMKEFGQEGEVYKKKSGDMKRLTDIEKKMNKRESLTKDELIFLYEIHSPIEGFGYERDPRIDELRSNRDPKADVPIIFECSPQEIAWSKNEINQKTKEYVGPLFPGIFKKLGHFDHIYTSFPEGKIRPDKVIIGGKDTRQLMVELEKAAIKFHYINHVCHIKKMMEGSEFSIQKNSEEINLIRLPVRSLGFSENATTNEIYNKAKEFGLELCPAEVGPQYRLSYTTQPMNERLFVAMKTISDPHGDQDVFELSCSEDGLWMYDCYAPPDGQWRPDALFVFRLPKQSNEKKT